MICEGKGVAEQYSSMLSFYEKNKNNTYKNNTYSGYLWKTVFETKRREQCSWERLGGNFIEYSFYLYLSKNYL